jgi:putative transposase
MWSSNPTWGSKRIQAELVKLGIEVSDSTIRKYRPRTRRNDQTWKTFLHNHAKDLIAVDFFVVPTATFRLLYVFLVLAHERRKVLHLNITDSPSAAWTAQQLTEAFPYANPTQKVEITQNVAVVLSCTVTRSGVSCRASLRNCSTV